jgi:hypothetical protein
VTAPFRLPEPLPAGESVVWIGRPEWRGLALRAFHVRMVAIYFSLLAVWRIASGLSDGESIIAAMLATMWVIIPGVAACGLLALLAWLSARSTRYIITTRRIVMQFGVALPMTLNVPYSVVGSAALKCYSDGTGDIPLATTGGDRIAYLLLWPHARPWRTAHAEPMLRSVADAKRVAEILSRALAGEVTAAVSSVDTGKSEPASSSLSAPPAAAAA